MGSEKYILFIKNTIVYHYQCLFNENQLHCSNQGSLQSKSNSWSLAIPWFQPLSVSPALSSSEPSELSSGASPPSSQAPCLERWRILEAPPLPLQCASVVISVTNGIKASQWTKRIGFIRRINNLLQHLLCHLRHLVLSAEESLRLLLFRCNALL